MVFTDPNAFLHFSKTCQNNTAKLSPKCLKIDVNSDPRQLKKHIRKMLTQFIENIPQKGPKITTFSHRVLPQNPPLETKVAQGKPQGHKIIKKLHFSHQKTSKL